jgi:hypothetical protein
MDPFVEVYVANSVSEAYVIKSALEGAGIRAQIANEYLEGALGGIPLDSTLPQVLVPRSEFEQAVLVLRDLQADRGEEDEADWDGDSLPPDEGPEGHVD